MIKIRKDMEQSKAQNILRWTMLYNIGEAKDMLLTTEEE